MENSDSIDKKRLLLMIGCVLVVILTVVALLWDTEGPNSSLSADLSDEGTSGPGSIGDSPPPTTGESWPTVPSDPSPTDPTSIPSDPQDPSSETEPGPSDPSSPSDPQGTVDPTDPPPDQTEKDKLSVDKIAQFSGRFVEDGSDRPIEDVAALLVTNRSERFLDIATIGYTIDGKKATFIVTGLSPGASCWVMEYTGLTVEEGADIQYVGCDTSFRSDVKTDVDEISIRSDGEHLFATNETDRTLENVFIYHKNVHIDGNFFGGITYMVEFGTLEPGETVERLGGHFSEDSSQIVRIGWQESQADGSS